MSHSFKLSRRIARFRLPAVALLMATVLGCDNANSFNSDSSAQSGLGETISDNSPVPEGAAAPMNETEISSASASFAGGIPIGSTAQPNDEFGSLYNGALRNIFPEFLARDLSAIKSRGGKIALMMAGPDFHYKDADGHFSLTKWKARIDRYNKANFNSYVSDGTIIGHYLIDEPNDPANWNGRQIDGKTLDEMAHYSKSKWPNLPPSSAPSRTISRSGGRTAISTRRGPSTSSARATWNDYLADNVASAKRQGLGLVVGLNYLKGGVNNRRDDREPGEVVGHGDAGEHLSVRLHQLEVQQQRASRPTP